jgi:hypothetical protein
MIKIRLTKGSFNSENLSELKNLSEPLPNKTNKYMFAVFEEEFGE